MKSNPSGKNISIKELREWLDFHENTWTETDVEYLGKFEDQQMLVWISDKGYSGVQILPEWGFGGPMIIPVDREGNII